MARRRRFLTRPDRGASAVEFALILPVLTLFIFGVIAFGFIFAQQISLNNGARDASRAGVVQPFSGTALTCGAIATQARNTMAGTLGISGASPTAVGVTVATRPSGGTATTICSMAAGSSSQTGSTSTTPCTGTTSGTQLVVTLAFLSQPPVPVGPFTSMNLSAVGSFACEYTN